MFLKTPISHELVDQKPMPAIGAMADQCQQVGRVKARQQLHLSFQNPIFVASNALQEISVRMTNMKIR